MIADPCVDPEIAVVDNLSGLMPEREIKNAGARTNGRRHADGARRRAARTVALALFVVAGMASNSYAQGARRSESAGMPVRFAEGTIHGFLELRAASGDFLAPGDLLVLAKDGGIESRMVFHFAKSVFEETVTFTQHGVFTMQNYHLIQSGPAFADDIDANLARSGAYVVRTKAHADGKERTFTGTLVLPPDVYNGMVITIAKNLRANTAEAVHIVAFTPEPRVIKLELAPMATEKVLIGMHEEAVSHIALKPKLGVLLRFFATLKGQAPPDSQLWIDTDQVPAFVRFRGPLYAGPVWEISLATPTWPH